MLLNYHIGCIFLGLVCVGFSVCRSASPDTTLDEPHPNSKTQYSKNNTFNVVVKQQGCKLLKADILMPKTC